MHLLSQTIVERKEYDIMIYDEQGAWVKKLRTTDLGCTTVGNNSICHSQFVY